jgi:competence protein ComEA
MIGKKRVARALACSLFALLVGVAGASPAFAAEAGSGIEGVVNVNTATAEQLQLLPGIGEARAEQIVSMRKQRGGFKSVDELTDVKGIGDGMMKGIRGHVTLKGKTTIQAR